MFKKENNTPEISSVEGARNLYINQLTEFRHQLNPKLNEGGDFDLLKKSAELYVGFFNKKLGNLAIEGSDLTLGEVAKEEIDVRRSLINESFKKDSLNMHPDVETAIGVAALVGGISNALAGRIPSALGGGMIFASSFASRRYKKEANIEEEIIDNDFLKSVLDCLDSKTDQKEVLSIFEATLESEEIAMSRVAIQSLKARTYTPFGFLRYKIYEFKRNRKLKKQRES